MAPGRRASTHPSLALVLLLALRSTDALAQEQVSPVAPAPYSPAESKPLWHGAPDAPTPPPVLVLEADAPLPDGFRVERQPRSGFRAAGLALGLAMYSISVSVAAGCGLTACSSNAQDRGLLIPLAGPFVQMAWSERPVGNVFLAIDGLGQLAGVGLFAAAYLFPRETLVAAVPAPFKLLPLVGSGLTGVVAVGRF